MEKIARMSVFGLFVGTVIWISGCLQSSDSTPDEPEPFVTKRLLAMDIADASCLVLNNPMGPLVKRAEEGDEPPSTDTVENTLYKITESGVYEEVSYTYMVYTYTDSTQTEIVDSLTDTVTTYVDTYPSQIININNNYMFANFQTDSAGILVEEKTYLVRKSDGAVFITYKLPTKTDPIHGPAVFSNSQSVQTDSLNNIYYVAFGSGLVEKINVEDPASLTVEMLTIGSEAVKGFRVDDKGNMMYHGEDWAKIRFAGGGLTYTDHYDSYSTRYWTDFNNDFCYYYKKGDPNIEFWLRKVTVSGSQATETDAAILPVGDGIGNFDPGAVKLLKMPILDKIIITDEEQVVEVHNSEDTLRAFALSDLGVNAYTLLENSASYYYIAGRVNNNPTLLKIDPSVYPHAASELLSPGKYDIYKMSVSAEDEIIFNALSMADGKVIIGSVSASGQVTILEEVEQQVTQLVRIQ